MRLPAFLLACPLLLGAAHAAQAQRCDACDADYGRLLQSYYLRPDPQIVEKTTAYLNRAAAEPARKQQVVAHAPSFLGFCCALAAKEPALRMQFAAALDGLADADFRALLSRALRTRPDSLFARAPVSPGYNDSAWGAYFATGDTRYLDLLLANCRYANERKNQNLYFTGASARWSLCANARQDGTARAYLHTKRATQPDVRTLLKADPAQLRQAIADTFALHRQRGSWDR